MPAIWACGKGQPRTNCANSQITTNGTPNDKIPINPLARRFAFNELGSISVPARNVRTALPSRARKLIHSIFAWSPRKFPARTPTRISMSATEIPVQIETKLATNARAIQIAATNQTFCRIGV